MTEIRFKALVTNISIVDSPIGERMVKVELTEEREAPGPIVMQRGEPSELSREIVPIISQILRTIPMFNVAGKIKVPRLTLYLTEDEWDKLLYKPTIGEYIEIIINDRESKSVKIQKGN